MELIYQEFYSEITNHDEARELLAAVSENSFSGNIRDLAREIGRETDEILDILNHDEDFDEDLLKTINRIAREDGIGLWNKQERNQTDIRIANQ